MRFSIGEIAVLLEYGAGDKAPAGTEVEIVSECYCYKGGWGYDYIIPGSPCHRSTDSINGEWFRPKESFGKKKPPEELSSWDKIEEICGWSPHVTA